MICRTGLVSELGYGVSIVRCSLSLSCFPPSASSASFHFPSAELPNKATRQLGYRGAKPSRSARHAHVCWGRLGPVLYPGRRFLRDVGMYHYYHSAGTLHGGEVDQSCACPLIPRFWVPVHVKHCHMLLLLLLLLLLLIGSYWRWRGSRVCCAL
ncbi:hypothetical protein GGR56DRAFT_650000 [Xylariaceae sp. FL0804]|nr:hypothetical protein GGR56DRAFT_650000 [Xylariaceae sp. FL0804]